MKKQIKIIGTVALIATALVTAFYAKGASEPAYPPENIPALTELRDPGELMSQREKRELVLNGLNWDNRPLSKEPVKVKGIYMSGAIFNYGKYFANLVQLVEDTELNSIVIDVKDDQGFLTTAINTPIALEIQPRIHKGMDARENMAVLIAKEIYPIARIVVFKDPTLAEKKPELAIRRKDGSVWRDRKGLAWVDPHNKEVWDYAVNVAKEAAKLGFREIQFDYVRFPTDGDMSGIVYPYATGQTKEDVIAEFLAYAKKELEPFNVYLAADVFGLTTLTVDDMGMGQKFEKIMNQVDYICPMVYPSHYGQGNYGFQNPNAHPYEVVKKALEDALRKAEGSSVIIRPWLQDFNLGIPAYGPAEVQAQIKGTYDAGLEEWILWNAGNKYTAAALARVQ